MNRKNKIMKDYHVPGHIGMNILYEIVRTHYINITQNDIKLFKKIVQIIKEEQLQVIQRYYALLYLLLLRKGLYAIPSICLYMNVKMMAINIYSL